MSIAGGGSVSSTVYSHAAGGAHTLTEISEKSFIPTTSVNFYLYRLQEIYLVERRLPVTQTKAERGRSKSGRYHLSDPYFRFYFQFLEPFLSTSPNDTEQVVEAVRRNLRAFVGVTAFEDLCHQWVLAQARAGQLPFPPDSIGSHWSSKVQVDQHVARALIENKAPLVLKDLPEKSAKWRVQYALFARSGFTPAAVAEMQKVQGSLVDLKQIDATLGR